MSETYSPALCAAVENRSPTVRVRLSQPLCVGSLRPNESAARDLGLLGAPELRIKSAQPAASSKSPSGWFLTAPTNQPPVLESRISEYMLMLTAPYSGSRPVAFDGWSGGASKPRWHLGAQLSKPTRRQETRRLQR